MLTLGWIPKQGSAQFVLSLPDSITVIKEVPYADTLTADLYFPLGNQQGDPLPVVNFMNGIGVPNLKNWDQYVGWGRLIVRAGLDNTFLNRNLDSLIAKGIQANAPLSFVNFSGGHHGFEIEDLRKG